MTEQCGLAIKNKYMIINKIDENTISVKKTETTTKTIFYNYDFLVEQRDTIIEDAENYALARQKEIEEIDILLVECKKLGFKKLK